MLVLSRKVGETITIGDNITLKVIEVRGGRLRIGIEAPTTLSILRGELNPAVDTGEHKGAMLKGAEFEMAGWTDGIGREARRHFSASHSK